MRSERVPTRPSGETLALTLTAIGRVLREAPLFRNGCTNVIEWHARPYMNQSPEQWITKASETLYQAAAALRASVPADTPEPQRREVKRHAPSCQSLDDHHVCDGTTFLPCDCGAVAQERDRLLAGRFTI